MKFHFLFAGVCILVDAGLTFFVAVKVPINQRSVDARSCQVPHKSFVWPRQLSTPDTHLLVSAAVWECRDVLLDYHAISAHRCAIGIVGHGHTQLHAPEG